MDTIEPLVLSVLNAIVAAGAGVYSGQIFAEQSKTRKVAVTGSFFRLTDYVRRENLDGYRRSFALFVSIVIFGLLELLVISPGVTELANSYVIDYLVELAGEKKAHYVTSLNELIPAFVIPFVTGVAGLLILLPQITFALSKLRDGVHSIADFKGDAQRLVDEAYAAVRSQGQPAIESTLQEKFEKVAPRPRELTSDEDYLAKYQLMYFATLNASQDGLSVALSQILLTLGSSATVEGRKEFFDFKKVVFGVAMYCFFVWLYFVYIPLLGPFVTIHLGPDCVWPDSGSALPIEIVGLSLQIALPLVYGIAFYDLNSATPSASNARKKLLVRIASWQGIVGLAVGLAMHIITVWRAKSGDNVSVRSIDYLDIGLIFQALFPSVIAPFLLWIWATFPTTSVSRGLSVGFAMSLLSGAMLGFSQRTYEVSHNSHGRGSQYYVHEFLIGFSVVAICLMLRFILRDVGVGKVPAIHRGEIVTGS
jgi:hypothetical protein